MSVNPLEYTSSQFVDTLFCQVGRGKEQVMAVYRSLFRTGSISSSLPEFANAPKLQEEILDALDLSLYSVVTTIEKRETLRFLIETPDNHKIESVLIPMNHGCTICISSQIGCKMGCSFCRTAKLGLIRNLTVSEIIQQVFIARFVLKKEVNNVVFMGMGEPLDNCEAVLQAVNILSDQNGLAIGPRHITISTSGIPSAFHRLANMEEFHANLTLSLNAPNNALRERLMPSQGPESLEELHRAIRLYCTKKRKQIYISYVLIKGVNDSLSHADELCSFLQGIETKINLIPFNTHDKSHFRPPEPEQIEAFMQRIRFHGMKALLRSEKGGAIQAACGQLAATNQAPL